MRGAGSSHLENIADEEVCSWLESAGKEDDSEEEGVLDWVRGIGTGAAQGAATGSMAGPWGALVGAVLGGALGAAQTAAQRGRPGGPVGVSPPPARAGVPAPPPTVVSAPSPPLPSEPTTGTAPPAPPPPIAPGMPSPSPPVAAAPGPPSPSQPPTPGGSSSVPPQILQQLLGILPFLTQLLSQQTGPRTTRESTPESSYAQVTGDPVPDDAFTSNEIIEQTYGDGIEGPIPDEEILQEAETETTGLSEYPLASRFVPAKYYEARPSPRAIRRIVIHITDGGPNINGTISWFRDPKRIMPDGTVVPVRVSAHYIVGQNGEVVQMVHNNDVAWHAHSANGDSIGIEHNARAARGGRPALYPTAIQYCSSAALVRWLCEQYGIPMDRAHIVGHSEADPGTTHSGCPNSVWNWDYFMSMITQGVCLPAPSVARAGEQMFLGGGHPEEEDSLYEWASKGKGIDGNVSQWLQEGFT